MELPAEIRNLIYTYALMDPDGINFIATFKHRRRTVERISTEHLQNLETGYRRYPTCRGKRVRAQPPQHEKPMPLASSLLAVSKQIYSEGLDILYSNEFVFADTFALYAFLLNLGPARAKHLKTLRLLAWGQGRMKKAYNHSCFAVLVWATNITAFHIDAHMYDIKHGSQQFYRDAFPWLEAMDSAKARSDAAVDVLHIGEDCLTGSWGWANRHHNPALTSHEDKVKQFKAALSKLLHAQQKRVMAKPAKKRKLNKEALADELGVCN
jgi:hypothetical protein